MPSERPEAFVWIWLPGQTEPVVAGRLYEDGPVLSFTYGQSYLARPDAIAIWEPELPLRRGSQPPTNAGSAAGCISDAAPDAWGRRIILNELIGSHAADTDELSLLTYLLRSGSNRIGALDFQASPEIYVPRLANQASVEELLASAEKVERGDPLSAALDQALLHGSSVGGARPKALLAGDDGRQMIAKFSSSTDTYAVVRAEWVAMRLAAEVGLDVADVELTTALGKDVLLVDRFDRTADGGRRAMVSALTVLGLHEDIGRYASYAELADQIRARFTDPRATLRELFGRIVFNILTGNTDDHARNHAAFWDGDQPALTPAYDICPQPRTGGEAAQVMAIGRDGWRYSQVAGCVEHASVYLLTAAEARDVIDHQITVIADRWHDVCDEARLTMADRQFLWKRQFLNPFALYDYAAAGT